MERKHNLEEISGNFSQARARFEEELATYPGKIYLLIEDGSYKDIIQGNYKTKISAKSFLATLHSFNHRYNAQITFMPDNKYSATWIYLTFFYYLREEMK